MNNVFRPFTRAKRLLPAVLAALCLTPWPAGPQSTAQAQVVAPAIVMAGSYQNFDVLNNTADRSTGLRWKCTE